MNHTGESALSTVLRDQQPRILADWRARLRAMGGSSLGQLTPEAELDAEMSELLSGLADTAAGTEAGFYSEPGHPFAQALRAATQLRAARGFTPEESLLYLQTCKEALVDALPGDPQARNSAILKVERLMDRCVCIAVSSFVAAREDVIRRQTESLREVSTPVISLWDSILLLPLVGIVDSFRAQQISERLLMAISQHEAEVTLIDVTGVPIMDTSVARHILKTVAAAEMLGTRVVLTGISPSTAQTMVKLGIDLRGAPTRATLKSGLALALTLTHRRIVDSAPE